MLLAIQNVNSFEGDTSSPVSDYSVLMCKQEEDVEEKDFSPSAENETDEFLPWEKPVLQCVKIEGVEAKKPENNNEPIDYLYLDPEKGEKIMQLVKGSYTDKDLNLQTDTVNQLYSLYSSYQDFSVSLNVQFPSNFNLCSIESEVLKGKEKKKYVKKKVQYHCSQCEEEQLFLRRKQDRERKAQKRAQETEKEKNLRRKRDRIAKAIWRATMSEEEKLIRREAERIRKANRKAFETEEEKRNRREKNKIAKAKRRAVLKKINVAIQTDLW